jgi:hypothetical protein
MQWMIEYFGFDNERIVMLHGYTKRTGQPASAYDMEKAFSYWKEYMRTRRVSPVQKEKRFPACSLPMISIPH